ncbi:MAG: 4Fe-4S binding protein, partial [Candidatus Omnitrophota bacterium]
MRYPKLRELKEAITALIKGPYTARFPYEEHKPFKRFRGKPYFYEEDCIGCSACVQVCPSGALEFEDI